jgi:UDP-N-acetylglucosamine--N-acetylmuramyl-(pentapeptide) pyrophosphoryl-undecaprenol N-acetylglucosamine transferase
VRGLARSLTLKNLLVPFVFAGALFQASALLNRFRPQVVVGTGGYVAMPVLKMAAVKKITTVLQEQNSFPGITTRRLAYSASRVYLGFEGAREHLGSAKDIRVTGNPVRADIALGNRVESLQKFGLDPDKKTVLIMGGSQGAHAINIMMSLLL